MDTTVAHLAARWAGADRALLRHVFPMLAEGRPVPVERIAERGGATTAAVEQALAGARADRDAQGRVVELSGLMLSPTLHRVEVEGVVVFSCCALLAHLTPLLLGRAISLESVDPLSRRVVRLRLAPGGVEEVEPGTAVGSFVRSDPGGLSSNVGANFCSHVHHFVDRDSAGTYARSDERRYVVEVGELRAAAEKLHQAAWV